MDFVKGNEIVKIDPHAIDLCGNNQITLGTEIITIDNKKTGTESSVTTLAPDYIKLTGYESQQPTGQEGVITLNRNEGKLTTYLNGTWTNILTGITSISTINDSRIKITGAHNTVANGIYNKNDSFSTNNANGDVYVNENGLYIEKDFNVSDQGNDPNWQQGPSNTDMEAYEYYVASDRTLDEHRTNAASMNAHLTSIVSAAENQYIHDIIQASGVSSAIPERVFIGLQPAPGYDWYSDMGSGVDISIENSDSNNMNLWEWSDGTQYEPGYGNFTNWYWYGPWEYPVNHGLHSYYTAGCAFYLEREVGNDVAPPNKWVPAKSENYRAVYKRRLKSTDIWKIYYDILGTKHTLYELYYTNTQNTRSLLGANIGSSDISGHDYINNNKSISNDTINLSTITVNLDPAINIAVNHPIYGGTYTSASSLSNNHHLEWNYGNYKIAWATVDDNINLNTNKLGWCLLDNSVIKYYSSGMTVDGITNGSSNPWDTDLRWEAVDGVNLTLPIINASNLNTSLEKNLQDWVINITDSSYEKANGTYRRDRSENINNRHVYYNEHGLKLYYGALEYDGETPNNNTVTVTSYTINTWISPTSGSLTTNYGASNDGTNPDSLIGYEYKITSATHSTWNDAEAAAKNEYAHLSSFQTYGEEQHLQNIIPNDGNYTWLGLYYDGTNISSSGTDSGWKFIDRTRTFSEGTTNTLLTWDTANSHPLTESNSGGIYTYLTNSDKIRNHVNGANYRAIFKRPQMWVQGTGSLTEYEYLLVNVSGRSWAEHESKAQELGGHLISIHSYEELQFIKTKFGNVSSSAPNNNLFIGLRTSQPDNVWNATTNNDWYYTDGTPFDFQFWGSASPAAESAGARYGTVGIYGWTASFTSTNVEMFNNRSDENCIAIYKRKRNSWRIVDGKDTIYRFGEPTITNTGSYVDSVTSLVMQPKYRNDHADESSRVVDGNYVTRIVANLTITGHVNTNYNGVYNYSNFKTNSTRKWVKNDNANIIIEYKENYDPTSTDFRYQTSSGFTWNIYNNNVLVTTGNSDINPWSDSGITAEWNKLLPSTPWDNGSGTEYQMTNGNGTGPLNIWTMDADGGVETTYSTLLPTSGQRGPGYLWRYQTTTSWGISAFTPETYFFHESPGFVTYHHPNTVTKNNVFMYIFPANKTITELIQGTAGSAETHADATNIFHIHWSTTNKWHYYKEGVQIGAAQINETVTTGYQSLEITYEPDANGEYQYYMNFFARSAGSDIYAINYPYDQKTRVVNTDRYLLEGGKENPLIKYGYKIGYAPWRSTITPTNEPQIYTRWLYHENDHTCNVTKVVTATTNSETNLQITGQLSGAGPTTSINLEHGITMTEGSGTTDSTVSVDKTNGVNIQNTDLAITDGNIIVSGTGKVGIGTTNPEEQLDVDGNILIKSENTSKLIIENTKNLDSSHLSEKKIGSIEFIGDVKHRYTGDGAVLALGSEIACVSDFPSGGSDADESRYALVFKTRERDKRTSTDDVEEAMRITGAGFVGIGTSNPGYPLHILGNYTTNTNGVQGMVGRKTAWDSVQHSSWTPEYVGIKVSGSIWVDDDAGVPNAYFLNSSDRRIKTDISIIDDASALDKVNVLESYQYNYIDGKKPMKTIGFIAQDVKEVIPNAVSLQKKFIPDEMRIITDPYWEGNTLTIPDLDMSGAFTGKAKFYVSNDPSGNDEVCKEVEIKEVADNSQPLFPTATKFVAEFDQRWNNVFFYGKQVSDFHTIDKAQIFALHHSAIQELSRKNDEKTEKIRALEEANQQKDKKINALEARLNVIEQQLNISPSEPPKTTTSLFKKV